MTFFYKVHKKISNQVLCPYAGDIFISIVGFCINYMVVLISLHIIFIFIHTFIFFMMLNIFLAINSKLDYNNIQLDKLIYMERDLNLHETKII